MKMKKEKKSVSGITLCAAKRKLGVEPEKKMFKEKEYTLDRKVTSAVKGKWFKKR